MSSLEFIYKKKILLEMIEWENVLIYNGIIFVFEKCSFIIIIIIKEP